MSINRKTNFRVLIVDFDKGHFKDIGTQKNWKRKVLHMSLDHDVPPKSIGNGEKFTINIPINKVGPLWNYKEKLSRLIRRNYICLILRKR